MAAGRSALASFRRKGTGESNDWYVVPGSADLIGSPLWGQNFLHSLNGDSVSQPVGQVVSGRNPIYRIANAPVFDFNTTIGGIAPGTGIRKQRATITAVDFTLLVIPTVAGTTDVYSMYAGMHFSEFAAGTGSWTRHNPASFRPEQVDTKKIWVVPPVHRIFRGYAAAANHTTNQQAIFRIRRNLNFPLGSGEQLVLAIDSDILPHPVTVFFWLRARVRT